MEKSDIFEHLAQSVVDMDVARARVLPIQQN